MRAFWTIVFMMALLGLAGCGPTISSHYTPSFADVRTLDTPALMHKHPIDLKAFSSSLPNPYQLVCRPHHNIHAPILNSFHYNLYEAIRADLAYLHLYHSDAPAFLQGNLDKLFFDAGGFGQGTWFIQMSFTGKPAYSTKLYHFTVSENYDFTIDQADPNFCREITDNYPSAVKVFIQKLYANKTFQMLLTQ